jgi:hypothetical protein
MPRVRRKPRSAQVDEPGLVVCIREFRPAPVGRLISRGDWLPRDHALVAAHPANFAAPLEQTRERPSQAR